MGSIRGNLLSVAAVVFAVQQAPFGCASPSVPDLDSYAEDDSEGFQDCPGHTSGQPICFLRFKSSDDGFLCRIVFTNRSAHCFALGESGKEKDASIGFTGPATLSTPNDVDRSGEAAEAKALPEHSKISSSFHDGSLTCGAGEDGSVACQNAAGHGFVLSHDGTRTW